MVASVFELRAGINMPATMTELYSTASGTSEPSDTERDTERDIEVKNMKDPLMGRHHRTTPLKVSVAV